MLSFDISQANDTPFRLMGSNFVGGEIVNILVLILALKY